MRNIFLSALLALFALSTAIAQQTKTQTTAPIKTATTKTATTTKPTSPAGASKDSMLCKPWKLNAVEEFAVKSPVTEAQKNDGLTLMLDTKIAFITLNGKQATGTWETDKGKTWLTITEDGTSQKWKYKLMKVAKDELVIEYQNPDDQIRTLYYFEPGPARKK